MKICLSLCQPITKPNITVHPWNNFLKRAWVHFFLNIFFIKTLKFKEGRLYIAIIHQRTTMIQIHLYLQLSKTDTAGLTIKTNRALKEITFSTLPSQLVITKDAFCASCDLGFIPLFITLCCFILLRRNNFNQRLLTPEAFRILVRRMGRPWWPCGTDLNEMTPTEGLTSKKHPHVQAEKSICKEEATGPPPGCYWARWEQHKASQASSQASWSVAVPDPLRPFEHGILKMTSLL